MPNSIEASTATVKQRLEAGASEQELAALIRQLAATNSPGVIRFDAYPLRKLAHDMAYDAATLEPALVLSRALTAALPDDAHAWAVRTIAEYLAKNYRDVIVTASRALAGGVEFKFILRARAVALMERGEPRAALDDVLRALALPGVSPTEDRVLEGLRAEAERAMRAIEAVQAMRDDLIAGRRSAADLFRRWSPFPLGVQDIRDAERGTRVFAKDFEWTLRVSYAVAEVAYTELEQGRIVLAREVFAALALVNSRDAYMQTMLAACLAK
ncbi:MAG TPA: hypothetical protein VM869_04065, partial [Enhygromyxa sp.]|nr:hypothetical protein [Enhygromyxa sp.]